jgi:hypothetical protein
MFQRLSSDRQAGRQTKNNIVPKQETKTSAEVKVDE